MSCNKKQNIYQMPNDYFILNHSDSKKKSSNALTSTNDTIYIESVANNRLYVWGEYIGRLSVREKAEEYKTNNSKKNGKTDSYPTLKETIKRFRREKGIDTQKTLCIMANMEESRLSKEIHGTRPINRDTLFALSLAMNLSLEETEELFHVADKHLYSVYGLSKIGIEREQFLLQFVGSSQCNVQEINDILMSKGMKLLGNFEDEVDDFSVAI